MAEKKDISRRNFLKGGAVMGGVAAMAGLVGCASSPQKTASSDSAPAENDWLGSAPGYTEKDCDETIETDVLVIGGAAAGTAAAFGAMRNGAKVMLIERNKIFHYGGNQGSFLNSQFQRDAGKPDVNPYELISGIITNTANRADASIWKSWVERSGEILDTLVETVGEEYNLPINISMSPDDPEVPVNKVFDINVVLGDPTADNYKPFLSTMHQMLTDKGVDIRYNTRAEQLVQDADGKVVGAIATAESGSLIYIKAAKGVIVATGSYAGNRAMTKEFYSKELNELLDEGNVYTMYMTGDDVPSETLDDGLGHRMMLWAGAEMECGPHPFLGWSNGGHIGMPYLRVDQAGKRFMNEAPFPVNQVQAVQDMYRPNGWFNWEITSSEDEIMPCFIGIDPNVLDTIAKSGAGFYKADTIEDLAKQIDVPYENLKATIDRYNELCDKKYDEDYLKVPEYLIPVKTPPFYAFNMKWVFVCTLGGVRTDSSFRVLNSEREPIAGLFAAGNTVGRRFGYAYESSGMGMSNAQAITAGYVAGETAALS